MKISLVQVYSNYSWDFNSNDDYLLNFVPTLKLNNKDIKGRYPKYARIGNLIKKHGPPNALYVRRTKGQSDHAAVQIHPELQKAYKINNSIIFEIPKNLPITDSNADFTINIVVDEVSSNTVRLGQENLKINLKKVVDYLNGRPVDMVKASQNWLDLRTNTLKTKRKHKMGSGYTDMLLTKFGSQKIIRDQFLALKEHQGKKSQLIVDYVVELVD